MITTTFFSLKLELIELLLISLNLGSSSFTLKYSYSLSLLLLKECSKQKGVFRTIFENIGLDICPAFTTLIGFNCKPPLAPIINKDVAIINTKIDFKIDLKENNTFSNL
tara:strand:+ start:2677 stop:3003 length:327 start_codon:yes stop_codon:yes gene_type:complete